MLQLKARRKKKDDGRSSTQHRRHAVEPTLRRQDALGRALPGAGGARQETLPDAWRRAGNGRSPRQQKCADAWAIYARSDRGAPAAASLAAAIAQADAPDRVIGRSPEIVACRVRGALISSLPTQAVVSSKAGSRRAGAEPGIMRSPSGRSKRVDAAPGPTAERGRSAATSRRRAEENALTASAARWRRQRLAFFAANVAGRGPPNARGHIDAFLFKRGARPLVSEAGHVWRSTPGDCFLFLVLFPVRDMRRLSTSPSRMLEPPSSRGAMIADHGANFEGEAPPVAPAGRHEIVFRPVPPRRQPRGALVPTIVD